MSWGAELSVIKASGRLRSAGRQRVRRACEAGSNLPGKFRISIRHVDEAAREFWSCGGTEKRRNAREEG